MFSIQFLFFQFGFSSKKYTKWAIKYILIKGIVLQFVFFLQPLWRQMNCFSKIIINWYRQIRTTFSKFLSEWWLIVCIVVWICFDGYWSLNCAKRKHSPIQLQCLIYGPIRIFPPHTHDTILGVLSIGELSVPTKSIYQFTMIHIVHICKNNS